MERKKTLPWKCRTKPVKDTNKRFRELYFGLVFVPKDILKRLAMTMHLLELGCPDEFLFNSFLPFCCGILFWMIHFVVYLLNSFRCTLGELSKAVKKSMLFNKTASVNFPQMDVVIPYRKWKYHTLRKWTFSSIWTSINNLGDHSHGFHLML